MKSKPTQRALLSKDPKKQQQEIIPSRGNQRLLIKLHDRQLPDVTSSEDNSMIMKSMEQTNTNFNRSDKVPYPTSFSNHRTRTYMTQEDYAESFINNPAALAQLMKIENSSLLNIQAKIQDRKKALLQS